MSPNFCSTCGTRLSDDAAFCASCGTSVLPQASSPNPNLQTGGKLYRLGGLAKALRIGYILATCALFATAMSLFYRASLLHDVANWRRVSFQDATDAENMVAGGLLGIGLTRIVLFILLIVWAWRATKNLQTWGAPLKWRPGWAIGGWFIPIGMLWIPYQVVRDAWRLAPGDETRPADQINGTWLFGFLSWWGSIVLLQIGGVGETPSEMRNTDVIAGFGALLGCASAIAILVAIGQISRRQDQAQTA
mgnify:CR=1 FL=1